MPAACSDSAAFSDNVSQSCVHAINTSDQSYRTSYLNIHCG